MKYKFEEILKGRKTYIAAILIAVLGLLKGLELFEAPLYVYLLLNSLGLAGIRAAVNVFAKSVKKIKE